MHKESDSTICGTILQSLFLVIFSDFSLDFLSGPYKPRSAGSVRGTHLHDELCPVVNWN